MSATDYPAMTGRIEPDIITSVDQETANASIAISLRRLADTLTWLEARLTPVAIFDAYMSVQAMVEAHKANINKDAQP